MKRIATAVSIVLLSLLVSAPGAWGAGGGTPGATETVYGGRAFAVWVGDPLFGTGYADTGELPSPGGVLVADFTPVDTDVADATAFLSYTRGFDDAGVTEVVASDVVLLAGTPFEVTASLLYARSAAVCDGVSGTSEIIDLTLGGVPFEVSGRPNQVYEVPGVFLMVVNEQVDSSFGDTREITVNAIRVWLTGTEVIVSGTRSAVTCPTGPPVPPLAFGGATRILGGGISPTHPGEPPVVPADFVTGGGHFLPPNSNRPGRVNFGFNAGPRSPNNMEVKGHLNLIDHVSGDHLKGVNVLGYARLGDSEDLCRFFGGDAEFNGNPGYRYLALVCDYGEPGRFDRFAVEVRLGGTLVYHADDARASCPAGKPHCGELDGGNIQLHRHHT